MQQVFENPGIIAMCAAAAAIGAGHTLVGPDHYVPFVAMSLAGRWSAVRTAAVTAACGLGHVAGSVVLGLVGIAAGSALSRLEGLEGLRGDVAAWLLVGVGLAYAAWGFMRAFVRRGDGVASVGHGPHLHLVDDWHGDQAATWGPWALFLVFVFGPCEPLIPLLMYPAATFSLVAVGAVATAFAVATVVTMMTVVLALRAGCGRVRATRFERYSHALAGLAVAACGLLVVGGL